jgi:hypothetical protein
MTRLIFPRLRRGRRLARGAAPPHPTTEKIGGKGSTTRDIGAAGAASMNPPSQVRGLLLTR